MCKPKLMPLKSVTLEKLEKMQKDVSWRNQHKFQHRVAKRDSYLCRTDELFKPLCRTAFSGKILANGLEILAEMRF